MLYFTNYEVVIFYFGRLYLSVEVICNNAILPYLKLRNGCYPQHIGTYESTIGRNYWNTCEAVVDF